MAQQSASGRKNYVENVAIVGASGSVGIYITEYLLRNGKHKVTAITRADSTSTVPDGVHSVKVNYEDPSSLVAALKGQDALIITMSVVAPRDAQSKLIDAAAKAGVRWVMPNEYSPDYVGRPAHGKDIGVYDHQVAARQQCEKLGIPWTGLVCSYWYEFSLAGSPSRYGFDFSSKTLTLIDDGETKINTSTWPQCGRAVANLLALKILPESEDDQSPTLSQFYNKPLYISSFLLSQKDMLASVLRVTGDKETDWKITSQRSVDRFHEGFQKAQSGNREGFAQAMYTRTFYKDGCGNYEQRGVLANDLLGLPIEDLDECTRNAVRMAEAGEGGYH